MTAETKIKALLAFVSLAAFLFGIFQFLHSQAISAREPYLTKKLEWCEEAVEKAAQIAMSPTPDNEDVTRFWQMYWGVMNLIERESIKDAMVAFGEELLVQTEASSTSKGGNSVTGLTGLARELAEACRDELALEWSSSWSD